MGRALAAVLLLTLICYCSTAEPSRPRFAIIDILFMTFLIGVASAYIASTHLSWEEIPIVVAFVFFFTVCFVKERHTLRLMYRLWHER